MKKHSKSKKNIDMAEIAKRAGVSKMTVSRAINTPKKVGKNTLLKINKIMKKTNFSLNETARYFRSGVSNNVFCFIPTLKGGNFNDYVSGILNESEKFNSKVIVEIYDYSLKKEEELLLSCLSLKPQGLILVGLEHSAKTKKILNHINVPVVETWDTSKKPIDRLVGFSHYKLGYDLTDRMIKKYKNILFVKSNYSLAKGDYIRSEKKFIGYRDRILQEKRKVHFTSVNSLDHLESGNEIIHYIKKKEKYKIDCIICDEICALGTIYQANIYNINIPKKLAVVGMGNSQTAQLSMPKLTTIDINAYQIGKKALSQIFQFDNNKITNIDYKFVKGESA